MRRRAKVAVGVVVGGVIMLAGAVFAGYWYFLRSEAEPRAEIEQTDTRPGGVLDGTYTLATGDADSFVGYRVQEVLTGIENTATGRTSDVEGSFTITGTIVEEVRMTADLTTLQSDREMRDNRIRTLGLESDRFPESTFVLSEPIELEGVPDTGETVEAVAAGEFTLHGVTREVEIPIEGRWDGRDIQVVGRLRIVFGNYDMEAPSIGGFVTVEDEGEMEFQLFFRRA